MSTLRKIFKQLLRKKDMTTASNRDTELSRCLTTTDLIALGVGSTLGAGVYVLTGSVARDKSGASIILSFLVAGFASVLAGLCYAEFGARVPKSGSAYIYSYVTVGELWAFVIGWNLILEYVIGTASVARAWSENVDTLIGGKFRNFSLTYLKVDAPGLAEYPDFFAFAIILILTGILCFGAKESATFSKVFTGINIIVILFVIIAGSISADTKNWNLSIEDIYKSSSNSCSTINTTSTSHPGQEEGCHANSSSQEDLKFGKGGFFPYGFSGMISGAATCFFGFVGFDIIATTGEEVKNPQRAIPLSIVVSLAIVLVAYLGISIVLTLMVPYYALNVGAPLPRAFDVIGWNWAVYPLAIGATCALSSSLMGGLFPMPRVVYAMAQDGLIFRFLSRINKRFKTPLIATLLSGLLAGIMVLLFDLEDLVDMMSIGTLLAYTLVAICILILRYLPDEDEKDVSYDEEDLSMFRRMLLPKLKVPSKRSGNLVYACTTLTGVLCFILCATIANSNSLHLNLTIAICSVTSLLILLFTAVVMRQPQSNAKCSFKVPFIPVLPIVSALCNIYLMCELSYETWIRFAVWMAIGFLIYGTYGFRNSSVRLANREKKNQLLEREASGEKVLL